MFISPDRADRIVNRRAISLFSGGLDSLLASRLILDQGIELLGVHFISVLCNNIRTEKGEDALLAGKNLGIRVLVRDKGEEYVQVVTSPRHGYGKNMNPCIDCRIYMLDLARRLMLEEGASFIVTGEVLGQRPMSQQRETMHLIEKESGLTGLIVRPLSARLFPPTLPEREGVIDRAKLLDISGRSRQRQYEIAGSYGLSRFSSPGGGCLLTDPIFAHKLKDLFACDAPFSIQDIALLRLGRHFRFQGKRLVLGRNKEENDHLEASWSPPYTLIRPRGFLGPSAVVKGMPDEDTLKFIGGLLAFYGKHQVFPLALDVFDGGVRRHSVERTEIDPEAYRIKDDEPDRPKPLPANGPEEMA
jgi:tRNA-specific 2-thiouridylase